MPKQIVIIDAVANTPTRTSRNQNEFSKFCKCPVWSGSISGSPQNSIHFAKNFILKSLKNTLGVGALKSAGLNSLEEEENDL
jgi:hypothetical protein